MANKCFFVYFSCHNFVAKLLNVKTFYYYHPLLSVSSVLYKRQELFKLLNLKESILIFVKPCYQSLNVWF